MYCIQACAEGMNVQGPEAPSHYPICRPIYALGLDACLYRDKLKLNEAYTCKLFVG